MQKSTASSANYSTFSINIILLGSARREGITTCSHVSSRKCREKGELVYAQKLITFTQKIAKLNSVYKEINKYRAH